MKVYVLHRWWDTPSNEGNEIMGVYRQEASARHRMVLDAQTVKTYYEPDFWEEDYTWENAREIHLGGARGTAVAGYATIYGWEIVELEVQ